jgi:hypothetical protein
MCDYSLEHVASRAAITSDRLVTTSFPNAITPGFASVDDRNTAVCLKPGTELAFDNVPFYGRGWRFWQRKASGMVARFRQINLGNPHMHHDAIEFADGTIVTVASLLPGQFATVLQLPSAGCIESQVANESKALAEAVDF